MKKHIYRIITILIFTFNLNVLAQMEIKDFPKKPKTGDCYIKMLNDSKWILIDCKLAKLNKNKGIEALQYKLKNLGYNIGINGCIDKKTIFAFEKEKKQKKIRARKELRLKKNRNKN